MPLIVLTADRPPELRDVGAGQTIDQLKLYGDAVKWFFEVGVHDATPERLRWIRTLACRAYWTALDGRPGPVHLNFPLREPLVLDRAAARRTTAAAPTAGRGSCAHAPAPTPPARRAATRPGRGVIVAGRDERDRGARPRGWRGSPSGPAIPLLADPLSGARHGPAAIAHYDLLLRDPAFAAAHAPELVIRVGDLPTSKPLRAWLASLARRAQIALDPEGAWQDPAARRRLRRSGADPARRSTRCDADAPPIDPDWLAAWRAADDARRRGDRRRARRRAVRAAGRRARSASGCRPTRRCSSPPRCRSATSRCSSPPQRDAPRACSPTAAPTASTAPSPRAFGAAAAGRARSCC